MRLMTPIPTAAMLVAASLLLVGCESQQVSSSGPYGAGRTGYTPPQPVDVASLKFAPEISVAVLPFSANDASAKAAGFEAVFFAGEMIKQLRDSDLQERVVFSPETTPAVDYVVQGSANCTEDDVWLTITVTDFAGRQIISQNFKEQDFSAAAGQALKGISSDTLDGQAALSKKLTAYAGEGAASAGEKMGEVVSLAARLEREKLLTQYTDAVLQHTDRHEDAFRAYRAQLAQVAEARRQEKREQRAAQIQAFASLLGGVGSALNGNQAGVFQAQTQMLSQGLALNASYERVNELDAASEQISHAFGTSVQPTSISFLNRVYKLSGNYGQQVAQFRELVKQALTEPQTAQQP